MGHRWFVVHSFSDVELIELSSYPCQPSQSPALSTPLSHSNSFRFIRRQSPIRQQ